MKRMISRATALGTAIALPAATMIVFTAPTAQAMPTGSTLFSYNGGTTRAFTLPANVNQVLVTVVGAGGGGFGGGVGGNGAAVTTTLTVPAGAGLITRVGGGGGHPRDDAPSFAGTAAGGSASSLQVNGIYVAVAGGGGGSTNGAGGSGAAANTADGGAGAGQYGGGGGTATSGGAGGGPDGPVAGGTVAGVNGSNAAAGNAGGGGGYWNSFGNGGIGMRGGSPNNAIGIGPAYDRAGLTQAGGGGAGFGGGGALGGGGGYSGGGGSSNAAGAGGSWVNGAYASGATTYRPAPYSVGGATYGLGGTAARPGGDGAIYVRWGSLPGKVTKLKVAGSPSAGKRKVSWKKPTGTVTGYKIVVTQKGKKKYNGVHLISKTVSPRNTVLKKKQLFAKAKKLNKFKGSRASFVVHVKAVNIMGEGPVAKKSFQAVK